MKHIVALFGEAEKGEFCIPHKLQELTQLVERLGHPPFESEGLFFAVQAILYNREILYFRVEQEGFNPDDYFSGFKYLENKELVNAMHALCLPGVGDPEILGATQSLCHVHKSFLITTQKDFYDYLTSRDPFSNFN